MADLARLQSECGVFELLLHIALTKETAERNESVNGVIRADTERHTDHLSF